MNFPIPALMTRSIYELGADDFKRHGIKFLMMDLDNTLAPYHEQSANEKLSEWISALKAAGIELFILSNNRGDRPQIFAKQLGVDYINRAKKPRAEKALAIAAERGFAASETGIIGDQIYTDVLCAVRCGFVPVCVRPICVSRNPLLAIRYFFELPFRFMYRGDKK